MAKNYMQDIMPPEDEPVPQKVEAEPEPHLTPERSIRNIQPTAERIRMTRAVPARGFPRYSKTRLSSRREASNTSMKRRREPLPPIMNIPIRRYVSSKTPVSSRLRDSYSAYLHRSMCREKKVRLRGLSR